MDYRVLTDQRKDYGGLDGFRGNILLNNTGDMEGVTDVLYRIVWQWKPEGRIAGLDKHVKSIG